MHKFLTVQTIPLVFFCLNIIPFFLLLLLRLPLQLLLPHNSTSRISISSLHLAVCVFFYVHSSCRVVVWIIIMGTRVTQPVRGCYNTETASSFFQISKNYRLSSSANYFLRQWWTSPPKRKKNYTKTTSTRVTQTEWNHQKRHSDDAKSRTVRKVTSTRA